MRVILTHEQADFDSIAALLGAHLLQENFIPVLPRKLNRNARSFLTLYGADLPFVDARDLPPEPIEAIILVDTQSLVTLKGITTNTRVEVVDHHQQRGELPENWVMHSSQVGATTTLFAENLQENNVALSPVQASLLLLGIYEDTGSLTYGSTTARDVRAAAYLLEQGASLAIVGKYLNPPLSTDQRRVYDRLLSAAQSFQIHGQKVVISCAAADDMHEEVSSVAHKLRDLLDPDALFLLVTTGEGLRLVARSTTQRINVAKVASVFGGGGHERAAAALIRPDNLGEISNQEALEQNCQKLIELLPKLIQPPVRVGQIMSRRPRLLNPDTPTQEAAKLMQRYGYEGFPVVKDNKVTGLLTRRAVDRAISHRLNLPASSLMESGEVSVHPDDSIDHLQQVMTSSGWGQVPVTDPENGDVIGIVTRTDLLKTLAFQSAPPTRQNLAEKLEEALPPAKLALLRAVALKAYDLHSAIYIVGGFVRDLLVERPSLDFDIVVEGDAIQLGRALAEEFGGRVVSHQRFGTAKWTISEITQDLAKQLQNGTRLDPKALPETLDLISARTEFYERPTALPTVERGSIKLDLQRRDFTINTLALRLDGRHYGELYDFFGGLNDLRKGLVRILHSLSFIDDPTRMLRAVRFEQRFGFEIETRTLQLIEESQSMLKQVSGDRIRHELDLILLEPQAAGMLERLGNLGILVNIHPDLPAKLAASLPETPDPDWPLEERYNGINTKRLLQYLLWLAPLPENALREISERLRFPAPLTSMLIKASQIRQALPGLAGKTPSQVVLTLDDASLPVLYSLFLMYQDPETCRLLVEYEKRLRTVRTVINGDDLRKMGVPPGPHYKEILQTLRNAWLDGKIHSPKDEQALLVKIVGKIQAS
jgi:tRNA nucleotidyltransferase (CCA-adding enzyme)